MTLPGLYVNVWGIREWCLIWVHWGGSILIALHLKGGSAQKKMNNKSNKFSHPHQTNPTWAVTKWIGLKNWNENPFLSIKWIGVAQEVLEKLGFHQVRGWSRRSGTTVHARHRGQAPRLYPAVPLAQPGPEVMSTERVQRPKTKRVNGESFQKGPRSDLFLGKVEEMVSFESNCLWNYTWAAMII